MLLCPAWRPTREQPDHCGYFVVPGVAQHITAGETATLPPNGLGPNFRELARCTRHPGRQLEVITHWRDYNNRVQNIYQEANWRTCWDCGNWRPNDNLDCPECDAAPNEPAPEAVINFDEDQDEDEDEGIFEVGPVFPAAFTDNQNRYWEWNGTRYVQARPPVTTTEGAWT